MKGLMVSLIIVFFAGMTSTVLAAGQQDAAEGESRFGLQPLAAPSYERPGPDDSDDDSAWPPLASSSPRESTKTSSFGDQQFGPAPENTMDNIRFDVKVDKNAIEALRQGHKVHSPVEVLDQSTKSALNPGVVSDIALFLDANAGKKLQGVQLDPQPMVPGSTTLRFEIPEQDLDRIEQDAFMFRVPNELRGQFDNVEFVAVSNHSASNEFSGGLTTGTRGSSVGFGSQNGIDRFDTEPINRSTTNPNSRLERVDNSARWNTETPQPGPGYAPGEPEFTGPYIDSATLESRRNRVAPLNTNDRFQLTNREPEVETRSPLRRVWDEPEVNQNRPAQNQNQSRFGLNRNFDQQNTNSQPTNEQQYQESLAQKRLRFVEQQLAEVKAEKESLYRTAIDYKREAGVYAEQRNDLSKRLQAANERDLNTQPVSTRPVDLQQRNVNDRNYLSRASDYVNNVISPYKNQNSLATPELGYNSTSRNDLAQRQLIAQYEQKLQEQERKITKLSDDTENAYGLLDSANRLLQRSGASNDQIQLTSGRSSTNRNGDQNRQAGEFNSNPPKNPPKRQQAGTQERFVDGTDGVNQEADANGRGSGADLIWLLPLLLASLALNFFLWVHSRSLALRYNDLADELRGAIGGSTI